MKEEKIINLSDIVYIEVREYTVQKMVYHLTDGTEVVVN